MESSVHVTFNESNLPKEEKGVSLNIDRLTEELEDLELNKDDETVAKIELAVDEDVPADAEDLSKEQRWAKHHSASSFIVTTLVPSTIIRTQFIILESSI